MNFNDPYFEALGTEAHWETKSWKIVEKGAGSGLKSWREICDKLKSEGRGHLLAESGQWTKDVMEVQNYDKRLLLVNETLVKRVANVKNHDNLHKAWSVCGNRKSVTSEIWTILKPEDQVCKH